MGIILSRQLPATRASLPAVRSAARALVNAGVAAAGVRLDHPTAQPGLRLGLDLIEQLSTASTIDSTSDGTTVTMRFTRSSV